MLKQDAIRLIKSDLRFRERLLQTWGMTWEEAEAAITEAIVEFLEEDRVQLPPGFVGEAGYTKQDEL